MSPQAARSRPALPKPFLRKIHCSSLLAVNAKSWHHAAILLLSVPLSCRHSHVLDGWVTWRAYLRQHFLALTHPAASTDKPGVSLSGAT